MIDDGPFNFDIADVDSMPQSEVGARLIAYILHDNGKMSQENLLDYFNKECLLYGSVQKALIMRHTKN